MIGVLAWLERSGGAPVHLFGWSYGALVAQLVAQARPDLVAGLIMFGYPLRPGIDVDPPNAAFLETPRGYFLRQVDAFVHR